MQDGTDHQIGAARRIPHETLVARIDDPWPGLPPDLSRRPATRSEPPDATVGPTSWTGDVTRSPGRAVEGPAEAHRRTDRKGQGPPAEAPAGACNLAPKQSPSHAGRASRRDAEADEGAQRRVEGDFDARPVEAVPTGNGANAHADAGASRAPTVRLLRVRSGQMQFVPAKSEAIADPAFRFLRGKIRRRQEKNRSFQALARTARTACTAFSMPVSETS